MNWKKKVKAMDFESNVRQWAWREAIEVMQRCSKDFTYSETMKVARELADFVLSGSS